MIELLLASGSSRRRELLDQIGVRYQCASMDIDESVRLNEAPSDYVLRMAREKAQAGIEFKSDMIVLAADTTVVIEGHILGKPENTQEAAAMLRQLSGSKHQVMTAVAVAQSDSGNISIAAELVISEVIFSSLTELQIEQYIATGEPMDKAGAYGIQGKAAIFIKHIQGSYSNIVGLPLAETAALLQNVGIPVWAD